MQGITFGDKHTFDDWGLYLVEAPFVESAEPNANLLEIDGANGYINLTEIMTGEPTYKSRKHTWKFKTDTDRSDWTDIMRDIAKTVHGQYIEIRLDEQPNGYYEGICTVEAPTVKENVLYLNISATLQPFWYENDYATFNETWTSAETRSIALTGMHSLGEGRTETDLRFGTASFPELNLSQYDSIRVVFDKDKGSKMWTTDNTFFLSVAAADGGAFLKQYTMPFSTIGRYVNIPISDIKASVDVLSKVWRIWITGVSNAFIYGLISGHFVKCAGGAVSVNPIIRSSTAGNVVSGNITEHYDSGTYECNDIKIPPEGTELCFKNSSGSAIISYRRMWL